MVLVTATVGQGSMRSVGSGHVQLSSVLIHRGQVTRGHGPQRAYNGSDSSSFRVTSISDGRFAFKIVTVGHFRSERERIRLWHSK